MTTIRTSLAIAWKELQITLRDRGLLMVLIVLPLMFGSLFSLSQQGSLDQATGKTKLTFKVYAVNEDEGPFGEQVVAVLKEMDLLEVQELDTAAEAEGLVNEGERLAAIIIPADFSAQIDAYEQTAVDVVYDPAQQGVAAVVTGLTNFATSPVDLQGELQRGIRTFIAQSVRLENLPPEAQRAIEAQVMGAIMTQLQAQSQNPPIVVASESLKGEEQQSINLFDIFMPAFAVMFAFFLTGNIGQTVHTERDVGTFRRLLAAPIDKLAMVAGPALAYVVVVVLQVLVLFGISAGLFGMNLGDRPLWLVVITLALGLAVAGMGLMLGALARTGRQADTIGTLLGFVLPFISGVFAMGGLRPGYLEEGFMATVGPFTPHMHAAEGFRLVMSGEGTAGTILAQVGFLLLFAIIFFAVARWRLKFE